MCQSICFASSQPEDTVVAWLTLLQSSTAGNETKSGMSRGAAEPKLTSADAIIDKLTIVIFMFQIVVVLVLGYFGNTWKDTQGLKVLSPSDNQYSGVHVATYDVPSHGRLLLYFVM